MNWEERYTKESSIAQHLTDVARTIWPDPGAVMHDIAWSARRLVNPNERARMMTTPSLLTHTIKDKVKGLFGKDTEQEPVTPAQPAPEAEAEENIIRDAKRNWK